MIILQQDVRLQISLTCFELVCFAWTGHSQEETSLCHVTQSQNYHRVDVYFKLMGVELKEEDLVFQLTEEKHCFFTIITKRIPPLLINGLRERVSLVSVGGALLPSQPQPWRASGSLFCLLCSQKSSISSCKFFYCTSLI